MLPYRTEKICKCPHSRRRASGAPTGRVAPGSRHECRGARAPIGGALVQRAHTTAIRRGRGATGEATPP
eukprot:1410570-Prymnesium_polylepis.1